MIHHADGVIQNNSFLCRTKGGFEFNLKDDSWEIDAGVRLNFNRKPLDEFAYTYELKECLSRYLETHSVSFVDNLLDHFVKFLRSQETPELSVGALAKWKNELGNEREYLLGYIRGLLYSWELWRLKGVSSEVVDWLEEQRIRGNVKGRAVREWCPYSGPYSSTELGWILEWVTDALREEKIGFEEHAAIFLLATTGQRPVQLRKLRSKDILSSSHRGASGVSENFALRIPMAKERLAKAYRSEFIEKPINRALYLVASNLRDKNLEKLNLLLDAPLSASEEKEVPLFLNWNRVAEFLDKNNGSKRLFVKEQDERPSSFHATSDGFYNLVVNKYFRLCPITSEVTGEPLTLSPRRFRYTYGTNCAKMGLSGVALAYALGHRDTQNVNHYVETSPEIATRINVLMEGPLTVVAQALAGTLVDSESDAVRGDDPRSRIKTSSMDNIGTCGSYEFCPSGWKSCYTCRRFQPWLDAPHEEALEEVLEGRKQMVAAGCSELVIHSSDRLILAIRKVIEMCQQRNVVVSDDADADGESL